MAGKNGTNGLRAANRLVLWASFFTVALLGAWAAFGIGFATSVEQWLSAFASRREVVVFLARALTLAQAAGAATLAVLAASLLAVAWMIRVRLIEPVEALRHSIDAAASGALAGPLWGCTRKDEIGALARAADRLRERAARRAGTEKVTLVDTPASLVFARLVDKLTVQTMRLERAGSNAASSAGETAVAPRPTAGAALGKLARDVETLEALVREAESVTDQEAAALTAAVIEAIDRLNSVAERIGENAIGATANKSVSWPTAGGPRTAQQY